MSKSEAFDAKYKTLNLAQKEAVDSIDGPVMVIAGPGTGKTTILTMRIAKILKADNGTTPDAILALTFTESGVVSMRKKLAEYIGPMAYQIKITTFHGYTNELIQDNPDIFPKFVSFNSATEIDQFEIIEKIISEKKYTDLRPLGDPNKYIRDIKSLIGDLKKENISAEEYHKLIKQGKKEFENSDSNINSRTGELKADAKKKLKKFDKSQLVADIFEEYEENLKEQKIYDYDDMILSVINAFDENPDFLLQEQEKYLYILADEHQDANGSQNKILEQLASFHADPNLFIVGDEKQAIFRFQGASLDNFLYFQKKYINTKVIRLEENYRSSQTILDSAFHLIDSNFSDERKSENVTLKSGSNKGENKIQITEYFDENTENYLLVKDIEKLVKAGEDPDEIAVIYRKNKEAYEIAGLLEKLQIPFFIKTTQDILAQEDVNRIRIFSSAVLDLTNNENLAKVIAFDFLKNNPIDLHKILKHLKESKKLLIDILGDEELLKSLYIKEFAKVKLLHLMLEEFSVYAQNESAVKFFEKLIYKTGILESILHSPSSLERLSAIERLFNELKTKSLTKKNYRIIDFVDYLTLIETYNTGLSGKLSPIEKGVNLMTAHGSKGLEFKHVFIPHSTNKNWDKSRNVEFFYFPNKKVEKENIVEDERRLFYVAITRAKEHVYISYSKFNLDGKENSPTQFLYEIKEELKEFKAIGESEIKGKYNLILNQIEPKPNLHDAEYIKNLFLETTLSVSAYNNYLNCPWKYFYQNLLRLPKDQSDEQKNGDAFHYALKHFYNEFDDAGVKPSFEKLLKNYLDFINGTSVEDKIKDRYIERATKDLALYYEGVPEKLDAKVLTEYSIGDIELKINADEKLKIYGKLDRVDFLTSGEILVTDYKTMEPKSKNEIMGLTQNSTGDYYRQLVFYKFLIDEHYKSDWKMRNAQIVFMKAKEDQEEIESLTFEIGDDEVVKLKEEIKKFADDVLNLRFWDKTCDDKDCEFCKFGRPE